MVNKFIKEGEELIFYNYKEPLREVDNGHGYYGILLSNREGTKIQCHICGNTYKSLSLHIYQYHDMKVRDYKEKFKLAYQTSLVSEKMREELKMRTLEWLSKMSPKQKRSFLERKRERFIEWRKRGSNRLPQPSSITLETRNKRGTCPDQLLEKIKVVSKHLGHQPTKNEFIDYYKSQKFLHIIYKTFGSYEKARKMASLSEPLVIDKGGRNRKYKYSKDELLEYLRIFYQEENKIPTETDCRRGLIPYSEVYRRMFGSFTNARIEAGITGKVGRFKKLSHLQ